MLSAVFKFPLPEISTSLILKDLIRSFEISAPRPLFRPPPWDLDKVLQYLSGPPFEPLARASFLDKTKKALFLLAMATAKRVWELQALSFSVSFQGEDLVLFYDPFFRAKTESVSNPLPVLSLFRLYRTLLATCPRESSALSELLSSFVKLQDQLRSSRRDYSSHRGIWNLLCRRMPCHSIFDSSLLTVVPCLLPVHLGLTTFVVLPHLSITTVISLSNLMQVATWRSNRVFASRYLKEVSATQDNIQQFGPLAIAGDRLQPKPPKQKHRL